MINKKCRPKKVKKGDEKYLPENFQKWFDKNTYDYQKEGSVKLCEYLPNYFHVWFDKDKFDYRSASKHLCMYCSEYFYLWFDPDKFDWKKGSWTLWEYCAKYFYEWFDPGIIEEKWHVVTDEDIVERWVGIENVQDLEKQPDDFIERLREDLYSIFDEECVSFFKSIADEFDIWFDKYRINWKKMSPFLVNFCAERFDEWFDRERFDYEWSDYLAHSCSEHFDKWWDPERFNWKHGSVELVNYCSEHFDKWWNFEKFNWSDKYARYYLYQLSEHFDKWFNPDEFDWIGGLHLLFIFNMEHVNKWWDSKKVLIVLKMIGKYNDSIINIQDIICTLKQENRKEMLISAIFLEKKDVNETYKVLKELEKALGKKLKFTKKEIKSVIYPLTVRLSIEDKKQKKKSKTII